MKKLFTILAGLLIMVSVSGQKTAGTPIQGTPIGLEGDPGSISIFSGKTDAKGQVSTKVEKGKYKLILYKIQAKEIGITLKITPQGGDSYSLPFETTPLAAKKGIAFEMKSKGTVLVTIYDRGQEITEKPTETTDAGPQKAVISTSRSNIRHPGITEGKPVDGEKDAGKEIEKKPTETTAASPQKAPINTSRSDIKHPN